MGGAGLPRSGGRRWWPPAPRLRAARRRTGSGRSRRWGARAHARRSCRSTPADGRSGRPSSGRTVVPALEATTLADALGGADGVVRPHRCPARRRIGGGQDGLAGRITTAERLAASAWLLAPARSRRLATHRRGGHRRHHGLADRASTTSTAGWSAELAGACGHEPAAGRSLGPRSAAGWCRRPRPCSDWRRARRWSSAPATGRARCSGPGPARCAPWSAGGPRPTCRCLWATGPPVRPRGMVLSRAAGGGLAGRGWPLRGRILRGLAGPAHRSPAGRAGRAGPAESPRCPGGDGHPVAGRGQSPVVAGPMPGPPSSDCPPSTDWPTWPVPLFESVGWEVKRCLDAMDARRPDRPVGRRRWRWPGRVPPCRCGPSR